MQKQHDPILLMAVAALGLWAALRPIVVWAVALLITLALAIRHRHQTSVQGFTEARPLASVARIAPRPHPLFDMAEDLQMRPARHLRALAGIRSKRLTKSALVGLALAMPL